MIDWRNVSLIGIDVGFSKFRKTTGIACYSFGKPAVLHCVGSRPEDRKAVLPDSARFDAIAIDGPIVPANATPTVRECERILSRGLFDARCKPGFSHFGIGSQLRTATATIATEMPRFRRHDSVTEVEAFPNAFLGIMLDDETHVAFGKIARGRKSDVFFAKVCEDRIFDRLLGSLGLDDIAFRQQLVSIAREPGGAAHEYRAALVCVLTAACALSKKATYVGDDIGGLICLPPRELWADWSSNAIGK